jgi:hypothetical protein
MKKRAAIASWWGRARVAFYAVMAALSLIAALQAQTAGQALEGTVINGTTGAPVANAKVNFVMMTQGTTPLATATTDAHGNFRFDKPPSSGGPAPVLLRVDYQGTTYSQPVLPQQAASKVQIQVFDAEHDPKTVVVKEHAIFLHPSANNLLVLEQILLENRSNPPKAYVNDNGTFPFSVAGQPREEVQVTVQGPGGMPIGQKPTPKKAKGSFSIAYPIRPGETQVRLEYSLEYKPPFEFTKTLDLPAEQLHVVTPGAAVQLTGEGLTSLGADPSSGFVGYKVEPNGNRLKLEISGDVPMKADGQAAGEGGEGESASLVPIPDPVSQQRWLILAIIGGVMLAGFVYHYTRA